MDCKAAQGTQLHLVWCCTARSFVGCVNCGVNVTATQPELGIAAMSSTELRDVDKAAFLWRYVSIVGTKRNEPKPLQLTIKMVG